MILARETIENIHNQYVFVNKASNETEPWELSMLNIEEHDEPGAREDLLQVLVQMYIDAGAVLKSQDAELIKSVLYQDLKSESILMRKVVLKAIRIVSVFQPADVLEMLIDGNFIDSSYVKEQVFLLIAEVFLSFSDKEKNALIDRIEKINSGNEDRNELYKVYNWCIWLQRIDASFQRVNSIVERMHSEYGFEPRKHPELNVESSSAVWIPDKSPLSIEELRKLPIIDAVVFLRDYKEDSFDGPGRYGLLKVLEECVAKDKSWTKSIINELVSQSIIDEDIWQHVFYGIDKSELSLEAAVALLDNLASNVETFHYDKPIANFLFNILRREDIKDEYLRVITWLPEPYRKGTV